MDNSITTLLARMFDNIIIYYVKKINSDKTFYDARTVLLIHYTPLYFMLQNTTFVIKSSIKM